METAAVPAERTRPGPLAALALVTAFPATLLLALFLFGDGFGFGFAGIVLGWIVLAGGFVFVFSTARRTLGVWDAVLVSVATWPTAAIAMVAVGLEISFGACEHEISTSSAVLTWGVMGVVYATIGFVSLRKRPWWGLPVAALLALGVGVALVHALPGTPNEGACFE